MEQVSERSMEYVGGILRKVFPSIRPDEMSGMIPQIVAAEEIRETAYNLSTTVDASEKKYMQVSITGVINQKSQQQLVDWFGSTLNLKFLNSSYTPTHAVANRLRMLIKLVQRNLLLMECDNGRTVCGIGESVSSLREHFEPNFRVLNSATPVLSGRDANRFTERGKRFGDSAVSVTLAEMRGHFDIMVATDVYDMSLADIGRSFGRCGLDVFSFSLIVPTDYFLRVARGVNLSKPMKVNESDEITYWFEGDNVVFDMGDRSLPYVHERANYEQLISRTIYECKDYQVTIEEVKRYGPYIVYHAYRESVDDSVNTIRFVDDQMAVVSVFVYNEAKRGSRKLRSSYDVEYVTVPYTLLKRLTNAMMTRAQSGKELQSAMKAWQAIKASKNFQDMALNKKTVLPLELEGSFLASVLIVALKGKAESLTRINLATEREKMLRTFESSFWCFEIVRASLSVVKFTFDTLLDVVLKSSQLRTVCEAFSTVLETLVGERVGANLIPEILAGCDLEKLESHLPARRVYDIGDEMIGMNETLARVSAFYPTVASEKRVLTADVEEVEVVTETETTDLELTPYPDAAETSAVLNEYIDFQSSDLSDVIRDLEISWSRLVSRPNLTEAIFESWSDASPGQPEFTRCRVENNVIVELEGFETQTMALMEWPTQADSIGQLLERSVEAEVVLGAQIELPDGYYFTAKEVRIFLAHRVIENLKLIKLLNLPREVKVLHGVPGFGKTYLIIEHWHPGSLILTKTKRARDETFADLEKRHGVGRIDPKLVRTTASFISGKPFYSPHIMVDEVTLMFYGELLACLELASSPIFGRLEVELFGDFKQISASARRRFLPRLQQLPDFETKEFGDESKRCPARVMQMIESHYEPSIYTTNRKSGGVGFSWIRSIEDVPYFKDVQYIVYTRKQKSDLEKLFKRRGIEPAIVNMKAQYAHGINTPEEIQGATRSLVIIVRPDGKVKKPYEDESFFNSAISRVTHHVILLATSVKEDMMIKKFKAQLAETELTRFFKPGSTGPWLHDECSCVSDESCRWFKAIESANAAQNFDCV